MWSFIHGVASNHQVFSYQRPILPRARYVDLFPFTVPDHVLLDRYAEWFAEQLQEPTIIVGHSMGGAIAQIIALKYPQKVTALVLAGTGPRLPVNTALLSLLQTDPVAAKKRIIELSLSPHADPQLLQQSLQKIQHVSVERTIRELRACQSFDVRAHFSQIKCPVLVIRGLEDQMVPPELSLLFGQLNPAVAIRDIPGAGHLMMMEQPDIFNEHLNEFLNDV